MNVRIQTALLSALAAVLVCGAHVFQNYCEGASRSIRAIRFT